MALHEAEVGRVLRKSERRKSQYPSEKLGLALELFEKHTSRAYLAI
jgi:hypothetical protein